MDSCQAIIDQLHQRGERVTIQRRLVIEALSEKHKHLTVQDIQQFTSLNEPTVYRIVQWLKDLGLVSQTDLGRSGIVYELIGDHRHHHMVCLHCGQIEEFDDAAIEPLRAYLRDHHAFEPRIDHMAIFGVCQRCRAASEATEE
jgi:Fur family transcriptional regulator, ferric uptake regulator